MVAAAAVSEPEFGEDEFGGGMEKSIKEKEKGGRAKRFWEILIILCGGVTLVPNLRGLTNLSPAKSASPTK